MSADFYAEKMQPKPSTFESLGNIPDQRKLPWKNVHVTTTNTNVDPEAVLEEAVARLAAA
eukprot:COSAG06_NODE_1770_length_8429_cov_5.051981_9_plen_59_part_01